MTLLKHHYKAGWPVSYMPWQTPHFSLSGFQVSLSFFKLYLFIYFGCAGSSLLLRLLSRCSKQGLLSRCSVWASHHGGFSLRSVGSRACGLRGCGAQVNSCGAWAYLLHGMWGHSGGVEPVSPALAGGFFTTEPPGNKTFQVSVWRFPAESILRKPGLFPPPQRHTNAQNESRVWYTVSKGQIWTLFGTFLFSEQLPTFVTNALVRILALVPAQVSASTSSTIKWAQQRLPSLIPVTTANTEVVGVGAGTI